MRKLILVMGIVMLTGILRSYAQQDVLNLTAQAVYGYDNVSGYALEDSTAYKYSNGRGSYVQTGDYKYDTSVKYQVVSSVINPKQQWLRNYDVNNRITTHIYQQRTGGSWRNNIKYLYDYNSASVYDTTSIQNWDTTANVWTEVRGYKYYYTGSRLDSIVWKKKAGSTWVVEARDKYTYSGSNLSVHLLEVWNDTMTHWDPWQQEIYTYTVTGAIKSYETNLLDFGTLTLQHSSRMEYVYTAGGNIDTLTYFYWNKLSLIWDGFEKHYYTYTQHNDKDLEMIDYWNVGTSHWDSYKWLNYVYDVNYNKTSLTEKVFNGSLYLNSTTQQWLYNGANLPVQYINYGWDDISGTWKPTAGSMSKTIYYYEFPAGISKASPQSIHVYPNPAEDIIHISLQWREALPFIITVHDMQGRLIYQKAEKGALIYNADVVLPGISNGNYMVRATNGKEEMTKLLVVANQ
ncbi:MAG: T9SS type A sorting domain-containing protein [Bacteroidetes bacterium]|nr:T9SS type A sorting domain-containing protein [Bacteroidota bacterium]